MADLNLVEAVTVALAYELEHDASVVLLGEDIGTNGGVFRATLGLQARFGAERVIDTPLAEAAIAGTAVGMAAMGLHPVAEIQFTGFIYPTIDHVLNHARAPRMSYGHPFAVRRGHPCAGAPFGKPRGVVRTHSRFARRHALVA
jgi:pyruvate/2-oxoglutarate/acetoin dehydrogenase E1 component